MHQFTVLVGYVKTMLLVKLGHESRRSTLVDPAAYPVIVFETPERAVVMCLGRVTVEHCESTIIFLYDVAVHKLVAHPAMDEFPVGISELIVAANGMIFVGCFRDRMFQKIAYAGEDLFAIVGIVDADSDPVVHAHDLVQSSHAVDPGAVALYLHTRVLGP